MFVVRSCLNASVVCCVAIAKYRLVILHVLEAIAKSSQMFGLNLNDFGEDKSGSVSKLESSRDGANAFPVFFIRKLMINSRAMTHQAINDVEIAFCCFHRAAAFGRAVSCMMII